METTPEEDELARLLYYAAKSYGRASWDDWLYKSQARAVLEAGYRPPRRGRLSKLRPGIPPV